MNTRRLPFDKGGCPYGLERLLFDFYGLATLSWLGNVSGDTKGCPKIPILEFLCSKRGERGWGEIKHMFKKQQYSLGLKNALVTAETFWTI